MAERAPSPSLEASLALLAAAEALTKIEAQCAALAAKAADLARGESLASYIKAVRSFKDATVSMFDCAQSPCRGWDNPALPLARASAASVLAAHAKVRTMPELGRCVTQRLCIEKAAHALLMLKVVDGLYISPHHHQLVVNDGAPIPFPAPICFVTVEEAVELAEAEGEDVAPEEVVRRQAAAQAAEKVARVVKLNFDLAADAYARLAAAKGPQVQ